MEKVREDHKEKENATDKTMKAELAMAFSHICDKIDDCATCDKMSNNLCSLSFERLSPDNYMLVNDKIELYKFLEDKELPRDKEGLEDVINKPKHYNSHPSGIECIEVTEHFDFCIGNAIKYLWRCGKKDDDIQELRKAIWYIERKIKRLEKEV